MSAMGTKTEPQARTMHLQATELWHGVRYRGKIVWWTRKLSDGSWLAVNQERKGLWHWHHRGPDYVGETGDRTARVRGKGHAGTAMAARALADRYLTEGVTP
jgi:hypothetical protein